MCTNEIKTEYKLQKHKNKYRLLQICAASNKVKIVQIESYQEMSGELHAQKHLHQHTY